MNTEEAFRMLHAYLDGELDAARSTEFERQLAADPALRAAYERQRGLSARLRADSDYHAAPEALLARVRDTLPAPGPARPERRTTPVVATVFAALVLLAIGLAFIVLRGDADTGLEQELIASHVRASLSGRGIDIASSDQHTVKPWLSARLDYSPPVVDLSAQGFELTGGRLDYAGGRQIAVLVYARRKHVIEVFVWPAAESSSPRSSTQQGFNQERFARGGMRFWIISDLNSNELKDFAQLFSSAVL